MINSVRVGKKGFSIKIKFAMIAALICLVTFGIAASFSIKWLKEEIENTYKEKATLISFHIIDDLESVMVQNDHQEIFKTLDHYKGYSNVEEVRIFNSKGKEVFFQEQGPSEAKVEEVLRSGEPIHFHKKMNQQDLATYIIPIRNKPECYACHGKDFGLRGALLLSLNQVEMGQYIEQRGQKYLMLFGLLIVTISSATIIAVNRLLLNPLRTIQKGAEEIRKGDFKHQLPVRTRDEIGNLTYNFNRMARTLQNSFKEISRSKKEWEETFDRINDPIVVVDSDCNILKANRAFQQTFAKTNSLPELISRKCFEFLGTCLLRDCPHKISMRDRTPMTREMHNDKTGKVFEVSTFPYYSPEEVFRGSVAVMKDVTGKKENEMRLMMSERLAALGELASGIAHEINNPLGTISACAEALLNRMEKEKIGSILFESYLGIIRDEIHRCKYITNSMLSFVRKRDNGNQPIAINEVLDRAIEMINFQGRLKGVDILRNYHDGVPVVRNNEGDLRQAFLSIIANAVDAMEGNGTLIIETGTEGNSLSIRISDTGPGIPPDLINKIFDPFFTTKLEAGGTGLGLSIANKIIKENNGKIEVASEEGKGTTFTITLPI